MLIDSWPLELFWILSAATVAFAGAAYVLLEWRARRRRR